MKKLFFILCLTICMAAVVGCGDKGDNKEEATEERTIYLDENGYCDFGAWGDENDLYLNGELGWATLYMKGPEGIEVWLTENKLENDLTQEEVRQNWEAAMVSLLQCPDDLLKDLYGATDEGIEKFRAYGDDYLSAPLAVELARTSNGQPTYIDEQGNYDVGPWGDYDRSGIEEDMTMYDYTPEEMQAWIEEDDNEDVYTPEGLRQHFAFSIMDIAGTSDQALKELYQADDEGIAKFRTYYNEYFCGHKTEN